MPCSSHGQILELYSHVFPEEIAPGLPPKRTIQHHIDLIPGAVLPNKPAYRMNPKETMEIQRQVEELLSKGDGEGKPKSMCCPGLISPKERWEHAHVCGQSGHQEDNYQV